MGMTLNCRLVVYLGEQTHQRKRAHPRTDILSGLQYRIELLLLLLLQLRLALELRFIRAMIWPGACERQVTQY